MRQLIPWWGRVAAKVILARIPAGYSLWRNLSIFRHGAMHRAEYALGVFQEHFARARFESDRAFAALELGPGDSVSSAVIAAAYGAGRTHLVDVARFATTDIEVYRDVARHVRQKGLTPPDLTTAKNVDDVLAACNASYGSTGIASLKEIPSSSIDFIWSHAVLEHIRRNEFTSLVRETRRVLKSDGICSHQIDLRDHLGGGLNNMRIPSRCWEAEWMAKSGFYTNRLRFGEMIDVFESNGFAADVVSMTRWKALPTPLSALAQEFRSLDPSELLVSDFAVVLKPT